MQKKNMILIPDSIDLPYESIHKLLTLNEKDIIMQLGPSFIMSILSMLYTKMRPILLNAVDDPDSEWDDLLMNIIDKIFLKEE